MNEQEKRSLTEEEKQRLVSFFEVLIQIDRKKQITETAKKYFAQKNCLQLTDQPPPHPFGQNANKKKRPNIKKQESPNY